MDRRPYACWVCRSDGSPCGVAGCPNRWRPTMVTLQRTSSWQTMWSCRGAVRKGIWRGSGGLYPLKTFCRGSYLPSVCGTGMGGQKKTSGGGEGQMQAPGSGQTAVSARTGGSKEMASLLGGVAERAVERVPGTRGSRMSLWPLRLSRGDRGPSVQESAKREMTSSTSTLSPPPPPPRARQAPLLSFGSELWHTRRVRSRRSWERGKQQARPGSWVRLPERQFPAASEVGRWARERLQCGEWDAWLHNLRACLPRAPPGFVGEALDPISRFGGGGG